MKALKYFVLLALLAVSGGTKAAIEKFVQTKRGTGIGGSMSITDPYHSQLKAGGGAVPGLFKLNQSEIVVKFYFDDALRQQYSTGWTSTVVYEIVLEEADGDVTTVTETLSVAYNPTTAYTDMVMKRYNANFAKLLVLSVSGISPVPQDVYLDLSCEVDRSYVMSSASPRAKTQYTGVTNTLKFDWTFAKGAEWYELEYLFVDYGNEALSVAKDFDFRNATRIVTSAQTYSMNMVYPRGKLLYRIRGVGYSTLYAGEKIYTNWSYQPAPGDQTDDIPPLAILGVSYAQYFDYNAGFEPGINWEYGASFAEDGKRTDNIGFMDGLMRGRQQVMMNQQEQRSVVSEVVYDYTGRPAVQFLPSPIKSDVDSGLNYYHDLNKVSFTGGDAPYDYRFFDTDSKTTAPDAVEGTISTGAAFYYSTDNTSDPGFNAAYIPDAEGYPFVRTQYLNDGTDRVKSQSGVGDEFRSNSTHEVKILYGSPASQAELDRLFGNEAGDVHMYSKEAVTDANGQQSVKYIDNEGRVIATALTGAAPANLHAIDSKPGNFPSLKAELHTYNQLNNDRAWVVNHSFIVAVEGDYSFKYSLNGDTLCNDCIEQEDAVEGYPHCADCRYDVLIVLTDNATGDSVFSKNYVNVNSTSLVTEVANDLAPGTYTIYKKTTLHEDFVSSNLQYFLEHQDCVTQAEAEGGDCVPSCTTMCEQSISYVDPATGNTVYFEQEPGDGNVLVIVAIKDSEGNFDPEYGDQGDVDALLETCLESCANVQPPSAIYPCDQEYQVLLADMTPGGQYFDNFPDVGTGGYDMNEWLDTYATVPAEIQSECSCSTWTDVRAQWKPEWAEFTVLLHPEYCAWEKRCEGCKSFDPPVDGDDYKNFYLFITGESPCYYSTTCTTGTVNTGAMFFNPTGITQNNSLTGIGHNNESYQPFDMPVQGTDVAYDPLMYCLFGGPRDAQELFALMNEMLQKFLPTDNTCTDYYSIWYVMQDPDGIAYDNGNNAADGDVQAYMDLLHGNSSTSTAGLIGTGMGQISEAEFFRRAYMLFRAKVLHDYVLLCDDPALHLVVTDEGKNADGFYVRYPEVDMFASWPSPYVPCDFAAMGATMATGTVSDLCAPYVAEWMEMITEQCTTYTAPQLSAIEAALGTVCANSDLDVFPYAYNLHASGTVTVNSLPCSTFEQVAEAYGCSIAAEDLPEIPQKYDQAECVCAQLHDFLVAGGFTLASDEQEVLDALIEADLLTTAEAGTVGRGDVESWFDECALTTPDYANFSALIAAFDCAATQENTQDAEQWAADCETALDALAEFNAAQTYNAALADLGEGYAAQIYQSCLDTGVTAFKERFTMEYTLEEYHYTLYYYDQAGNLVKTVSPEGVARNVGGTTLWTSILDNTALAATAAYRATGAGTYVHPQHQLITNYKYNSLNQLTERTTADEGTSRYFYDYLGRLVASQNAKQTAANTYSIVLYDELSRDSIAFIGSETSALTQETAADPTALASWLSGITGAERTEITEIFYDEPLNSGIAAVISPSVQENLRNRVAAVAYTQTGGSAIGTDYDYATHYSYDIHGNVQEVVQDNARLTAFDQHLKRMQYEYELVSGNVTKLKYQQGKYDQFYHQYDYDKNNQVEEVYTSKDGQIWERDADYFYQPTGQLARAEQGQRAVNGQDFAYTLQGWLKGVNSNTLNAGRDIGKDGNFTASTEANKYYGLDVMGYTLGYYQGDYTSVTGTSSFEASTAGNSLFTKTKSNLYNGNIGHVVMAQNVTNGSSPTQRIVGKGYEYDQLNRLKEVELNTVIDLVNNDWDAYSSNTNFKETGIKYDGNGNILGFKRYHLLGSVTDDLTYQYNYSGNHLTSNQLHYVDDAQSACTVSTDIDDQASGNYTYNEIGQLKSDANEFIEEILWYERGKVRMVVKDKQVNTVCSTEVAKTDVEYIYDGLGYKIGKIEKPHVAAGGDLAKPDDMGHYVYTWYVNDAMGNVLSIYGQDYADAGGGNYTSQVRQEELMIAGGMYNPIGRSINYELDAADFDLVHTADYSNGDDYEEELIDFTETDVVIAGGDLDFDAMGYLAERTSNQKQFALTNHLGSVVTVTSDRKLAYDDGTPDGTVDRYIPEINSWYDTYAFGSVAIGGVLAGTDYRYGFNGIEKAKELYSGAYEADFRMVDSRLGRWFSPDPIVKPWESVYAGFSNNPIWFVDPSGLDPTNGNGTSIPTGGNNGENPKTGDTKTRTNKDGYQTTYVYKDGIGWTLPDTDVAVSSNGGSPGTSSNSGSNRASTGRVGVDNPYKITTGIPGLGGIVYNKSWEKTFLEVSEGFSKRMSSNMTWGATSLPMPVYDDDDDAQTRRNKAVGAILADFLSIEIGTAEITAGALGEIASFGFGSALFLPMIAHGVGVVTTSGIALSTDVQVLFMADAVVTDGYHGGNDEDDDNDYKYDDYKVKKKDKFRGGKQKDRDSYIKQFPKEFQRWYHKYYKRKGDRDASDDKLKSLYDQWIKQGSPTVK